MRRPVFFLLLAATLVAATQANPRLLRRWVGSYQGRPMHLDFYGDTMLVLNDALALDYRATRDSLVAVGDTSFAVSFWFALDRMLLQTAQGDVITMAPQDVLARPIEGRWLGTPSDSDRPIELRMTRSGTARWRREPDGTWVSGEWDRVMRVILFTWLPDSVVWTARYDPGGNAMLVSDIPPDGGSVILRRFFRR